MIIYHRELFNLVPRDRPFSLVLPVTDLSLATFFNIEKNAARQKKAVCLKARQVARLPSERTGIKC